MRTFYVVPIKTANAKDRYLSFFFSLGGTPLQGHHEKVAMFAMKHRDAKEPDVDMITRWTVGSCRPTDEASFSLSHAG
jgi:hypothetical protein